MKTVAVLYRGALAQYQVGTGQGGDFEAALLQYNGSHHDLPPPRLRFKKDGRHCQGDTDEQDLMDDLFLAVSTVVEQ